MQIIQNRKKFFILSLLVIIIGFGFMIANAQAGKGALNWDVEFTGGTSMELNMNGKYDNDKLISIIKDVTDQSSPQIQEVLGTNNVEINCSPSTALRVRLWWKQSRRNIPKRH